MRHANAGPAAGPTRRTRPAWLLLIATALLGVAACRLEFVPEGGDGGDGGTATPPPPQNIVSVRLMNLTDWAVEAQFYVSDENVDASTTGLFVPENIHTTGVGLASQGILEPLASDLLELPCTTEMVLGTAGGIFRDPDTGNELGRGSVRVLQKDLVFDCGDTLTLAYMVDDNGFTVTFAIE